MKPKNFILITLVVILVCFVVGWFMRLTAPEKTADASAQSKSEAPNAVAPSAQIVKPLAPPVQYKTETANPPAKSTDPQADLKTAIPDIARLLLAGDLATYQKTYTPPDRLDFDTLQAIQDAQNHLDIDLSFQQYIAVEAQRFVAIETQTPKYNDAGDEATFTFPETMYPDVDGPLDEQPIYFVKINGKWYVSGEGKQHWKDN